MKLKKIVPVLLVTLLVAASAASVASALEPHGTGIPMRNWLKNDPDYTFSDSYKTSVWYENFTSLALGENQRNNILRIAVSQLGYHEGEDGDYSGTNTGSSGNCVEYFRLLIPNWSDNSDEWCACFVNWCLNQAHIDYASSEIGCWKWVVELKAMKMFENSAAYQGTYTPRPADMIFFHWADKEGKYNNTGASHIGYVLYTTDERVYTIEGNADNNVTVRSYALNDPCVIGYGTPPYEEGNEPTWDYSYANGMPRGVYVVNSMSASLTSTPSSGRICRVPLGSTVTLTSVKDGYAHVTYGEEKGYLPANILYLMIPAVGEDTLTYDANGGTAAPEATTVTIGATGTVSDTIPTLDGDTFRGWSLTPHNYKVDYKPGDTISPEGDTTLYAVWEKHSLELANAAIAEGLVAEFDRPAAIENSAALLLGTLADLSALATVGDTKVEIVTDDGAGTVLSFSSTAKSDDPYVTLDYAALCSTLLYAPATAENVDFLVMKVKNVSLYNTFFEITYTCGDGTTGQVSTSVSGVEDWQYIVFNMTNAEGWNGNITSLRLDWERAADDAGNTLLVADLFLAPNEATRDALINGAYTYPTQIHLEPETEAPTEAPTEPVTTPEESTTAATTDTATGTEATTQASDKGCASVLPLVAVLLPLAVVTLLRKKDTD